MSFFAYFRRSGLLKWSLPLFVLLFCTVWGQVCFGEADRARINKEFPIKDPQQLSPPIVSRPIHPCAEAVYVFGFVPGAEIKVIANGAEEVGKVVSSFGYTDVNLTRQLQLGEQIAATQSVGGKTSAPSVQPVTVTPYPDTLTKPEVNKDLYECGLIVPVGNLVESTKVLVYADGVLIGEGNASKTWLPVWTAPLQAGQKVTAVQSACDKKGPESDPVIVKPMPVPVSVPEIDQQSLIVGNDAVLARNLLVGSALRVQDGATAIGGGYTTGSSNWCHVDPPLKANGQITATQKLCDISEPSEPEIPVTTLKAPVLVGPICKGAQFLLIRETTINANVIVFNNGKIVGYGGAVAGDLFLSLSKPVALGDVIYVRQTMGSKASAQSNSVTVTDPVVPVLEIQHGEPFFLPEANETAIDGPVFPRFRGIGPKILVQSCCAKNATVQIFDFNEKLVKEIVANELFPGYFEADWKWSDGPWQKAVEVPVGRYRVTVKTDCYAEAVSKTLYIIFDPNEVNGPDRFSFNEIGIWFGTGSNRTRSLTYQLHPDDQHIFSKSITAAQGETDSNKAAQKVARAEEALFAYSLSYHSNDTLDLLANFNEAQCADDANMLTAMLRAVGIPAHPATADAALETGQANWTFDTWTEFLVPVQGQPQWMIIHPHEFPGMGPENRNTFGTTRDVAKETTNDLVVMAGENWNPAQIPGTAAQFKRNSCDEPEKVLSFKQPWLVELCEAGYWQNHWDCDAGGPGPGLNIRPNIQFDHVRRTLSGNLAVAKLNEDWAGRKVVVELVSDLPESHVFPDEILGKVEMELPRAAAEGERGLPIKMALKKAIPPGQELYLRVSDPSRTIKFLELEARPGGVKPRPASGPVAKFELIPITPNQDIRSDLSLKKIYHVGETVTISGVVSNTSRRAVTGVRATLAVPPGFKLTGAATVSIRSLKPREKKTMTWQAMVKEPVEAAAVKLIVDTADGGWAQISGPVRVPYTRPPGENRNTVTKMR